jgi:hypothetical protein
MEMQDPIGDRRGAGLMGDDHHCPSREAAEQLEHGGAILLVEVAGWLVSEDDLRIVDQRPRDREALLFSARELLGAAVGDGAQAELFYEAAGTAFTSSSGPGQPGWKEDVLLAAELLDQVEGLEDEADVAEASLCERVRSLLGQLDAGETDAAGVGAVERSQQV